MSTPTLEEDNSVSVSKGVQEFEKLVRQLSISHPSVAAKNTTESSADVEKSVIVQLEQSELHQELRSASQNGILVGKRSARIPVHFSNLSISVPTHETSESSHNKVTATLKALKRRLMAALQSNVPFMKSTVATDARPQHYIINGLTGMALSGEMVLVLGRPGSGCSTFLRAIANLNHEYVSMSGDISYGGIESHIFKKQFPSETVLCAANDTHLPTLTVRQTLGFAIDAKAPGRQLEGQGLKSFKETVITGLLKIFSLTHVQNNLIGDAQLRGISGGERKRVSIAELMLARALVSCWDNSTLGLDAASATDFVRSLRILTEVYESTTFVSLYQSSDLMFELFHKVLVLEGGHQVYYGRACDAEEYFTNLGFVRQKGQSIPDFLCASVDARLCGQRTGPLCGPSVLAEWFRSSSVHAANLKDIAHWQQNHAAEDSYWQLSEDRGLERRSRWAKSHVTSFGQQVLLCFQRHALLKIQNKSSLFIQNTTSIIVALLCGSVFFALPETSAGAFTRGGLMFITLLYNAFTAFAELPSTMLGRPLLRKHKSFGFHRASALYIGQILFDIPLAALQLLLFTIIVYFMAKLRYTAQAFFTFYLLLILGQAVMTVFFRTLGCVSRTFDGAMKFACVIIILFVLTSGYLLPYTSLPGWIRWFFWINPISFCFSALMMNEFKDLTMVCIPENLVPHGPSYTNISHQVCTLAGASSGSDLISGSAYLLNTFDYDVLNLWRNLGVMVLFLVLLLVCNILAAEIFDFEDADGATKSFNTVKPSLLAKESEHSGNNGLPKREPFGGTNFMSSQAFTWDRVNYSVPVKGQEKQLLHNVSGYSEPGSLLALMGASGAGKSTLLDVLSMRKSIGSISGEILAGAMKPNETHRSGMGYCEQLDTHESTQTVREALRFSAYLRQPVAVSKDSKDAYVEDLIALLEMDNFADSIIGQPQNGLSIEERKRLSIGVELAAKPDILLFLDEPTSGLDSQSAINIVRFLRKLADAGQSIICTIHQPNPTIFAMFDRLLLLSNGQTVFSGPTTLLQDYFAEYNAICPPNVHIAEYMLMILSEKNHETPSSAIWAERWEQSRHSVKIKDYIETLKENALKNRRLNDISNEAELKPFFYQLRLVTLRAIRSLWRTPGYISTRVFNHLAVGLLTGLAYIKLGFSTRDLQSRIFVIFQITVLPSMILSQVEPRFEMSRIIFNRERDSNMYSKLAFLLSVVLAEIPCSVVCAVLFYVTIYFPSGFSLEASRAAYQFAMILITELFSVLFGQAVAALTPSSYVASLFTPFLLITFSLFCGVTVPPTLIPTFWRSWLYPLNPFTYLVGGMMETELHGIEVRCDLSDTQTFTPPPGQTCQEYTKAFLELSTGYLVESVSDDGLCRYCPFRTGDQYLAQFEQSWDLRYRHLGVMATFTASSLVILIVAGMVLRWSRR